MTANDLKHCFPVKHYSKFYTYTVYHQKQTLA